MQVEKSIFEEEIEEDTSNEDRIKIEPVKVVYCGGHKTLFLALPF